MHKYRILVSKEQKKYMIVMNATDLEEARQKVHDEGYSILSIDSILNFHHTGTKLNFEIEKDGKTQTGKVIGNDIFKVYKKLRLGLSYKVNKLYFEEDLNLSDAEKKQIIIDLEDQYAVSVSNKKTNTDDYIKKLQKQKEKENGEVNIDNFYLNKELKESQKLVEFVLKKISNLVENKEKYNLEETSVYNLEEASNLITKLKKTTNISKLKEIGEQALLKVGQIELRSLEKDKNKKSRAYLKDTNKLLKKIGSSKQFIEKDKDVKLIVGKFLSGILSFFKGFKSEHREKKKIDKHSYSYLKTIVLLGKYKKRLKDNTLNVFKNLHVFFLPIGSRLTKRDFLLIKRRVIKQNISLLRVRKSGKTYSYTRIKKGYTKLMYAILWILEHIKSFIFSIIVIYAGLFIIYLSISGILLFNINYQGIIYFLVLLLIYIFSNLTKGFISLFINIVILSFIVIFSVVNF